MLVLLYIRFCWYRNNNATIDEQINDLFLIRAVPTRKIDIFNFYFLPFYFFDSNIKTDRIFVYFLCEPL